ncbi:MAG: MATE family efflux transporter [Clostridiales bacterium]|nr:MATE family efflux transporter [Clostridiales bacterium]
MEKSEKAISSAAPQSALSKNTINPLGTEKVGRLILRFSVPSIISLVVVAFYNIVDQIFIGQSVGYLGNAATNIVLPFATIIIAFGNMLSDGTAANMSLRLGAGDEGAASRGVGNCITLMIIFGVVSCILFEIFLPPLCRAFGAIDTTFSYAMEYGRIIVLGFPFSMIDGALTSVIRADGRPKQSMTGMLIGCGTNVILDWLFCLRFGWGVAGAAWGTIIGQAIVAVYYIILLFFLRSVHMEKGFLKPEKKTTKKILTLGLPSFVTQISIVLVMFVMNNIIVMCGENSKYGPDIPLAVIGITMKFCTIAISIGLGVASGTQPVWGYNYGSGQYDRVKQAFRISMTVSTVILIGAFIIFEAFPMQLIGLFGKESDLYLEFAVKCIRHYLAGTFMVGAGLTSCIFFQALGHPIKSTVVTLLRQVFTLIPAILILGFAVGINGLIWAGAISDCISGIIAVIMVAASWKKLFNI